MIDGFNQRLSFDVPTIESVGGGSVRCMVAEVFEKEIFTIWCLNNPIDDAPVPYRV